jgi:hypothetical protein
MLVRRIGRNELSAIKTCLAYVDAQREYAEKGFAGKGVYAQRFVSQPGQKDGLYWPVQSGENRSPLGELAAARLLLADLERGQAIDAQALRTAITVGRRQRRRHLHLESG